MVVNIYQHGQSRDQDFTLAYGYSVYCIGYVPKIMKFGWQ